MGMKIRERDDNPSDSKVDENGVLSYCYNHTQKSIFSITIKIKHLHICKFEKVVLSGHSP